MNVRVKFCQLCILAAILICVSAQGSVCLADSAAVDLELVLAVDASGSVDEGEYALQLGGIAAGFRDRAVKDAIRSGPFKRIVVNLLTWAEPREPKSETGWYVLKSDADADAFAGLVEYLPRSQNGATGLGEGIAASVRSITGNGYTAKRMVVDVSGDGIETNAREYTLQLSGARAMAYANGVTINGLAIETEVFDLKGYYRDHMSTGPGSFVMSVGSYRDFAEAMRKKLLKEIEYRPTISLNR